LFKYFYLTSIDFVREVSSPAMAAARRGLFAVIHKLALG